MVEMFVTKHISFPMPPPRSHLVFSNIPSSMENRLSSELEKNCSGGSRSSCRKEIYLDATGVPCSEQTIVAVS